MNYTFNFITTNNDLFITNNWLVDNIYSANSKLQNNILQNFFYFFFSFNYNFVINFIEKIKDFNFFLIFFFQLNFKHTLLYSYMIDYFFLLKNILNYSYYFFNLNSLNFLELIVKEPDLIFFYFNLHNFFFFKYETFHLLNFEFLYFYNNYESYFDRFFQIFFNYYIFIVFFIFTMFTIPLAGKTKIYSFINIYIDFILLIPNLIEVSLEDFLFLFIFFKVLLIYFLLSMFMLNKFNYTNFIYFSLPFIFVVFGSLLCFIFSKHLASLFIYGPTVYTGINFSNFSQSVLLGLVWDYVVIVLMFFRFGVVLARLILVWMNFILVEVLAYFFMEPAIDDLFSKINFLWKNNYSVYNYLSISGSFNTFGESFLIFFITCFYHFCSLLLEVLQLMLFLFFGFFLTCMFTGYMDIENFTNYFKQQYLNIKFK